MEKVLQKKGEAIRHIRAADHILTQTYPHLKDQKLLLAVFENIYASLENALTSLCAYLKHEREIDTFEEAFRGKLDIVSEYATKLGISKETLSVIKIIYEIEKAHKVSAIEFSRKDAFVISSDTYNLKTITVENLKNYIKVTKSFLTELEKAITTNNL